MEEEEKAKKPSGKFCGRAYGINHRMEVQSGHWGIKIPKWRKSEEVDRGVIFL